MQTYKITAPDGTTHSIQGPPGASREQIVSKIQERLAARGEQPQLQAPPVQQLPPVDNRSVASPPTGGDNQSLGQRVRNSPIGGMIRGIADVGQGGMQMAARTLEGLPKTLGLERNPAAREFEKFMKGQRANLEQRMQMGEREYTQDWRQGEDVGLDVGRIAGNVVGALPLAAAVPGIAATSAAGKTAYGVGAGAVGALTQPVLKGDFWDEKTQQAVIGGAAGAAGPHLAKLAGKGISAVKRAVTPAMSRSQATEILTETLKQRGVNFNRLAKETQDELLDQTQRSLNVGADLNIDELARKADFDMLGMEPTRGQLSHNPQQVRFEKNTAGITGPGDELANRFNQQNAQLIDNVNQMHRGISPQDSYNVGQRGIDALTDIDANRQQAIGKLYDDALNDVGIDAPLNSQRFMDTVKNNLDDIIASHDELPIGVNTKLKQIASGDIPFTIKKGEQIRKAINKRMGSASQSEKVSLKAINDAIQTEIDAVGMSAGESFKTARAAAANRFGQLDANPAMKAVSQGKASPDDFVKKFVLGGKATELRALKNEIQSADPDTWTQMRGQIVDYLKQGAIGNSSDELGTFSQKGFRNALNKIGNTKLKVVFDPAELRQLRAVARVSEGVANQPVGASVNNSNTTAAMMNMLNIGSNVPMMQLFADPVKRGVTQRGVSQALKPQFSPPQNIPGLTPQQLQSLTAPLSVMGYPLLKPVLE